MSKRMVYLASAHNGDRELLKGVANSLSAEGHMVFAPCLGWFGDEERLTTENARLLKLAHDYVQTVCEVTIGVSEGVASIGLWRELEKASNKAVFVPQHAVYSLKTFRVSLIDIPTFDDIALLKEWLNAN